MTNPCSRKQAALRTAFTLGYADYLMRCQFTEGDDEWKQSDNANAMSLNHLETMMVDAAKEVVSANRAHELWLQKLRDDAAQQVNNAEAD